MHQRLGRHRRGRGPSRSLRQAAQARSILLPTVHHHSSPHHPTVNLSGRRRRRRRLITLVCFGASHHQRVVYEPRDEPRDEPRVCAYPSYTACLSFTPRAGVCEASASEDPVRPEG